jgi:hypothetical protein
VRLTALENEHWAKERVARQARAISAVVRSLVRRVEQQANLLAREAPARLNQATLDVAVGNVLQRPRRLHSGSLVVVRCCRESKHEKTNAHPFWLAHCLQDVECHVATTSLNQVKLQWWEADSASSVGSNCQAIRYERGSTQKVDADTILCVLRDTGDQIACTGSALMSSLMLTACEFEVATLASKAAREFCDDEGGLLTAEHGIQGTEMSAQQAHEATPDRPKAADMTLSLSKQRAPDCPREMAHYTDSELRLRQSSLRRSDLVRAIQLLRCKAVLLRRGQNSYTTAIVCGIDMAMGVRRTRFDVEGEGFEWVDARLSVGIVQLI